MFMIMNFYLYLHLMVKRLIAIYLLLKKEKRFRSQVMSLWTVLIILKRFILILVTLADSPLNSILMLNGNLKSISESRIQSSIHDSANNFTKAMRTNPNDLKNTFLL